MHLIPVFIKIISIVSIKKFKIRRERQNILLHLCACIFIVLGMYTYIMSEEHVS